MKNLNTIAGFENVMDGYFYDGELIYRTNLKGETKRLYFYDGLTIDESGKVQRLTRKDKMFLFKTDDEEGFLMGLDEAMAILESQDTSWDARNFVQMNLLEGLATLDECYFYNLYSSKVFMKDGDDYELFYAQDGVYKLTSWEGEQALTITLTPSDLQSLAEAYMSNNC